MAESRFQLRGPLVVEATAQAAEAKSRLFHYFGGAKLPASPSVSLFLPADGWQQEGPCLVGMLAGQAVVAHVIAEEEFRGLELVREDDGSHAAFAWFNPMPGNRNSLTIDLGQDHLFNARLTADMPARLIEAITMTQAFIASVHISEADATPWSTATKRLRPYRPLAAQRTP